MTDPPVPESKPEKPAMLGSVTATGTSVGVGTLAAWFIVPEFYDPTPVLTASADVHGLLMALTAGIIAAGARGAGDLLAPYLPRRKS